MVFFCVHFVLLKNILCLSFWFGIYSKCILVTIKSLDSCDIILIKHEKNLVINQLQVDLHFI